MVQGIETLQPGARDAAPQIPQEAVAKLGQAFSSLSEEEIQDLRDLSDSLREMSPDELATIKQVVDFLIRKKDQYDVAVQSVIRQGMVEPGDLPPDFDPVFFDILSNMIDDVMRGEEPQKFARGGIASLNKKAKKLAGAGRYGDTMLAHLGPDSVKKLKDMGGSDTVNPTTGLREYGLFSSIGNFFKKAVGAILPIALSMTPLGPVFGAAIGSGIGAMINGATPGQALTAGLMGGVGGALYSGISGAMSGQGFMTGVSNAFTGGVSGIQGMLGMGGGTAAGAPAIAPATGVSSVTGMASEAAMAGAPSAPAAPGFLQTARNWISANPLTAAGIAGLGGVALASAMTPEEKQKKISERNVEPVRFAPGTFKVYEAPKVNVVPTYSPAYAGGGEVNDHTGKTRSDFEQRPHPFLPFRDRPQYQEPDAGWAWWWRNKQPDWTPQEGNHGYGNNQGTPPETPPVTPPPTHGDGDAARWRDNQGNRDNQNKKNKDLEDFPRVLGSMPTYQLVPTVPLVPTYSPAYAATGGEIDARRGGHMSGPGTGTSDDIPARLSDGEFVMTAKAVRGAGAGDRMKGAKRMYDMMHKFEKRA